MEALGFRGLPHGRRRGRPDEHQLPRHARHPARDGPGQGFVHRGLVVERAVRLHVDEPRPVAPREGQDRAHLVHHVGFHLGGAGRDRPPAEPAEVVMARVRPDRHPRLHGPLHRPIDHLGIAGMEPASHVRRGDVAEDPFVVAELIGPEALAQVRVQVDRAARHRRGA